eukprot:CAMPEP_0195139742 /NCGR_PEP_ID=MMETSP0448-20130528/159946_1 /TAXON_ID=66468 /ORGANISM="Heterocapsa triquestra, Strain CCMP 448" /LENGTH=43 /DNA_ID= /DNA_START= /DNA_END= /DNA_ORIENTATION=
MHVQAQAAKITAASRKQPHRGAHWTHISMHMQKKRMQVTAPTV